MPLKGIFSNRIYPYLYVTASLVVVNLLIVITCVESVTVEIRSGDEDWSNIKENTLFVNTSKIYELLCSSEDFPVKWTTSGILVRSSNSNLSWKNFALRCNST